MAIWAAENWASNYDIQDLEYKNHFPNNIDCSKILDSLLEESQEDYYYNEGDERLNSLIQSLEAEITSNSNHVGKAFGGDQSSCSSLEFNLMEMDDSSLSSNADNTHLEDGESSTIEACDKSDFEDIEMMCQGVPFVEDSYWEETNESYMLN